jgi:cystathionine beta-lyase
VVVVADEIHQDIIVGATAQTPMFAVADGAYQDILVTVVAASKSFNLAGLVHSHILIADKDLRDRYDAFAKTTNQTEVNIMGCTATQAAYTYGGEWLDSLIGVLKENYAYFVKEFKRELPLAVISPLEGTYLLWVDMRPYTGADGAKDFIQGKCHIAADYGDWFSPQAKGFVRFNLATDPKNVHKTVDSIVSQIHMLKK